MKKSIELIVNIVFWLVVVSITNYYLTFMDIILASIPGYGQTINPNIYYLITINQIPETLFILIVPFVCFYSFYLFLVPRLLSEKKFIKFFLISALILILSAIAIIPILNNIWDVNNFFKVFIIVAISGLLGCLLKGTILWIMSIADRKALQKKQLESKTALLLLKAQLNPHFLFNSLNNIDILIEEKPKMASEYLKKLSDILRYVLYETKEDETELVKEITQIKNYIELQKLRTDNSRYINFNISGELKTQKIAPMIFLPFIENAFKHSMNKTIDNAIDVEFELKKNEVKMVCKNYYEANKLEVIKNEGLGIETIKQRLNLLYPESHELIIDKTEHWFSVTLSIKLKDGN